MRIAAAAILLPVLFFSTSGEASWLKSPTLFGPAVHKPLGPKPRASCGWYMRKLHGGRYGREFNRAYAWARLPRTTLSPGAVVVSSRKGRGCGGPCGHVVKVVRVIDACRAIVNDNRGTYERNTCRNRVAVVRP